MSDSAASSVNVFADQFWEAMLELNPTTATVYGDERYDDRLEDPGPAGRAAARSLFERTLVESNRMPADGLGVEDRITLDLVRVVCDLSIEQDDQRFDLFRAVDQIQGPQTLLPQVVLFQPADTPERLQKLLARIEAYRDYMAANTELLREAAATGLTHPGIVIDRTIAQLEGLLASSIDESPIVTGARVASGADRARVAEVVERVVRPADQAYLDVLRTVYSPAARPADGLWSAPNGEELYRTQMLAWTTLKLDPQELHDYGKARIVELEAERRQIAQAHGFGNDTHAYRAALAADPSNLPASREELVRRATEDIERALAVAPRAFGRLPSATCEVREVDAFKEKDSPFAYYYPPTADGSRPGIYYVNAYDLPSRTYSTLGTTTYHEAVPGHHFQIALEMEHPDLPAFRRFGSRLVGSSYVEGWGLYSEQLADELGLFRNEAERFGMLDAQAWRAARLVVDTGLHALRWSRQQSIDFLRETGLTDTNAIIETDRYITWPAQALTYMVGQRELVRLRRQIAHRDGSRFDLRAFHDAVLGHGSLPLATLARELPGWVAMPV